MCALLFREVDERKEGGWKRGTRGKAREGGLRARSGLLFDPDAVCGAERCETRGSCESVRSLSTG